MPSSWWEPAAHRHVVTSYKIYPSSAYRPGHAWVPQPTEVEEVLELSLPDLVSGYELKRLIAAVCRQDGDLHRRAPPGVGRDGSDSSDAAERLAPLL